MPGRQVHHELFIGFACIRDDQSALVQCLQIVCQVAQVSTVITEKLRIPQLAVFPEALPRSKKPVVGDTIRRKQIL